MNRTACVREYPFGALSLPEPWPLLVLASLRPRAHAAPFQRSPGTCCLHSTWQSPSDPRLCSDHLWPPGVAALPSCVGTPLSRWACCHQSCPLSLHSPRLCGGRTPLWQGSFPLHTVRTWQSSFVQCCLYGYTAPFSFVLSNCLLCRTCLVLTFKCCKCPFPFPE